MVINHEPKVIYPTEEEQKTSLIEQLSQESLSVLALAAMYARNMAELGEDVTARWATTARQTDALQRAYNQGYYDALMEKGKKDE